MTAATLARVRASVTVRATTPTYEGLHPIARTVLAPAGGAPLILDCSEMAVALHHSGVALSYDLPAADVAALVVAGIARHGVGQVRTMAAQSRAIGLRHGNGEGTAADTRQLRRVWPHGPRRRSIALQLAADLACAAEKRPFNSRERADRRTRR
jgi:hypothetical protein